MAASEICFKLKFPAEFVSWILALEDGNLNFKH